MRQFSVLAFLAAVLALGFAGQASAEGDCSGGYTRSVDISTPDQSIADSSSSQTTKSGKQRQRRIRDAREPNKTDLCGRVLQPFF